MAILSDLRSRVHVELGEEEGNIEGTRREKTSVQERCPKARERRCRNQLQDPFHYPRKRQRY